MDNWKSILGCNCILLTRLLQVLEAHHTSIVSNKPAKFSKYSNAMDTTNWIRLVPMVKERRKRFLAMSIGKAVDSRVSEKKTKNKVHSD